MDVAYCILYAHKIPILGSQLTLHLPSRNICSPKKSKKIWHDGGLELVLAENISLEDKKSRLPSRSIR